jgi:gluconate 2-dehydrogenase gamma chain
MSVLTPDQAAALDAMTTRILPSVDGRPGAHEAGAVFFIDRSLATFAADQKGLVLDGIQDLNRRAADKHAKATATFAMMTGAEQDALLREIEQTPFFQSVRFATIVGTFALPTYGGNRDFAGWRMLGLDHQPMFQAPFGYYDAQAQQKG